MERAWRGFAIVYASKNNIAVRLCEEMKKGKFHALFSLIRRQTLRIFGSVMTE
jgi:hypothetical protein